MRLHAVVLSVNKRVPVQEVQVAQWGLAKYHVAVARMAASVAGYFETCLSFAATALVAPSGSTASQSSID